MHARSRSAFGLAEAGTPTYRAHARSRSALGLAEAGTPTYRAHARSRSAFGLAEAGTFLRDIPARRITREEMDMMKIIRAKRLGCSISESWDEFTSLDV